MSGARTVATLVLCHALQTEMYSVMTVSSEPTASLGWLSFSFVFFRVVLLEDDMVPIEGFHIATLASNPCLPCPDFISQLWRNI